MQAGEARGEVVLLVHAAGHGGPTAAQRAIMEERGVNADRAAVLSDSVIERGIVNEMKHLNPIKMFSRFSLSSALSFLSLSEDESALARTLIDEVSRDGGYMLPSRLSSPAA